MNICMGCTGDYCDRHGIQKHDRLRELCRTRRDYFDLWEGQHQDRLRQCDECEAKPLRIRQFLRSFYRWIRSGFAVVGWQRESERLTACGECPYRRGLWCALCCCFLWLKARWATEDCPIGRWTSTPQTVQITAKSGGCGCGK